MSSPVHVSVTGAAGSVGYALIFRIGAGALFGPAQPVALSLLEIPPAMPALEGVALELEDCAFPLLASVDLHSDPEPAFDGAQYVLLVGAHPRPKGFQRSSLIHANMPIFQAQGQALNRKAAADVRVTVVGNPANLNCLVASRHAPDLPPSQFTALTRLDQNRAVNAVASKAGVSADRVTNVAIWGNHSATQYPCLAHAQIDGHRDWPLFRDVGWMRGEFIPRVQGRGAEILDRRGQSSAASAASALIDHVRSWHAGTEPGRSVSMAIHSAGQYDTPAGVFYSFPVTVRDGVIAPVEGLILDAYDRSMLDASSAELMQERALLSSA